MEDQKKYRNALIITVIAVVIVGIVFLTALITAVVDTSKAVEYDLNCVAEPIDKPLTDCRR